MRYVYYNEDAEEIIVYPEQSDTYGKYLGSISDQNFGKLKLGFFLQSLCFHNNITPKGVAFAVIEGPSKEPDNHVNQSTGSPAIIPS